MNTNKINWASVWRKFNSWYNTQERNNPSWFYIDQQDSWKRQRKVIQRLVKEELNEKK